MTDPQRRPYIVGAWKIPHDQRDLAHAVLTPEDDRGFFNIIGADADDDDERHPVGTRVTYRVELTDAEAERFRQASNVRYVELDVEDPASTAPWGTGSTPIPRAATLAFMEASFPGSNLWHGRDVPLGIVDGGTTQAVRDYMGWTRLGRFVNSADDPGADEITEDHGCWTTSQLVPPGGRFWEAVSSSNTGGINRANAVAAWRWLADTGGVKVISYSFNGAPGSETSVYEDGIIYLRDHPTGRVHLFVSAGNNAVNDITTPAGYCRTYPNVHGVVNVDETTGQLSPTTNYDDQASGTAPGVNVLALNPDATVRTISGTSHAAPHAARLCAMIMTGGRYTADQAAAALRTYSRPLGLSVEQESGGAFSLQRALQGLGALDRSWQVISGPAHVGEILSWSTDVSFTPTVAGTYTLRYSATNEHGTGTDDVQVMAYTLNFPVTAPLRLSAALTGAKHTAGDPDAPPLVLTADIGDATKRVAVPVDAPLRLAGSATGKRINWVIAPLRLSAHLSNAGSSQQAFVNARMRLSAAATDPVHRSDAGAVAAALDLAAAAEATSARAGDVAAALRLAAAQTGAKQGAAAVAAHLELEAAVAEVHHAGQAARVARVRLAASIDGRFHTGGSAVTARMRLHTSTATRSVRFNQPVGPARLRLWAVVFGQRIVTEVDAVTPRADTTTKYELVAVARIPQVSGPPMFLEVDPIDWTELTWAEALGESPTLSASVKIDTLTEPILQRLRTPHEMPTELWLNRNGRRVFAGPLLGGRVSGEALSLEASGIPAYLRWMHVTADLTYTGVDQFTIVAALINQWQQLEYGHFGIDTSTVGVSGVLRTIAYPYTELHKVADRIDDLAKLADGFDMVIDPTSRHLQLYSPTRGADRSTGEDAIIFDLRNVTSSDITFSTGPADVASEGLGTGTASGSDVPLVATFSNVELRARFGRTGITGTFQTDDQAALAAFVQALVDARDKVLLIPGPNARVSLDADLSSYDVGDTIGYQAHARLTPAGAFRIRKRSVQVAETGTESVAVEFT